MEKSVEELKLFGSAPALVSIMFRLRLRLQLIHMNIFFFTAKFGQILSSKLSKILHISFI